MIITNHFEDYDFVIPALVDGVVSNYEKMLKKTYMFSM